MASDGQVQERRRIEVLRIAPWVIATGLLLTPLIAMQFTSEVDWGLWDFVLMGALLYGACGLFELAARARRDFAFRAGVAVGVGAGLLLTWVNMAVGVTGNEDDPTNLMFFGVVAFALAACAVGRFKAAGMARAFAATAFLQALAAIAAALFGAQPKGIVLAALYVGPWLAAAWLFRRAAATAR